MKQGKGTASGSFTISQNAIAPKEILSA